MAGRWECFIGSYRCLYRAFVKGEPSPLPELPIQYADFAVWQREWLQGEVLDRQLSYWKKQLGGDSCGLESADGRSAAGRAESIEERANRYELSKELTRGAQGVKP